MSIKDFKIDFDSKAGLAFGEHKAEENVQAKAQGMCGTGYQCAGGGGQCGTGYRCAGG